MDPTEFRSWIQFGITVGVIVAGFVGQWAMMRRDVRELRETVYGNGSPGLKIVAERHEGRIARAEEDIGDLREVVGAGGNVRRPAPG